MGGEMFPSLEGAFGATSEGAPGGASGGDRAGRARLAVLAEMDLLGGEAFPDLDRLTALAADICGANLASFTVHDATRAHQLSVSFGAREVIPCGECVCAAVLASGELTISDNASIDARLAWARHVAGAPFVRSYAGAPVGPDPQTPVGVLSIGHTEPGRFGPEAIGRLQRIAELVSGFLRQRLAAQKALRAAARTRDERSRQLRLDLVFEAIREGVHVYDCDGEIIETNASACDILGLSRDQQMGREARDPRWRIVRRDGSHFAPADFPVHQALSQGGVSRDVEMGVRLADGSLRWISVNTAPVRDLETGAIEYAVVTFKDVTAQYQAEEQLAARNQTLARALVVAEAANEAKSNFLGVISHELRTPMNAVMGCAQLLKLTPLNGAQQRALGVLEDAGRTMTTLLSDLLDVASLDAAKVRITPEAARIDRLIEVAVSMWRGEAEAKGLSLNLDIDRRLARQRMVDPARLGQIVNNLLANAVKFTDRGGVSVTAKAAGDRVEIAVADTGPGVPEEAASRIFLPFEQVDVSMKRRHGGLGIGLHVARRLAVAMGGDIAVNSREGEGATFAVTLDAPPADPGEPTIVDVGQRTRAREVLCVDDNERNLFVIGTLLRAAGHTVAECTSGADALQLLAERKFDLVLLDMVMPGMDGLDVMAALRQSGGPNAATPVVACTANVLPEQLKTYERAGLAGVIAKPIDAAELIRTVAGVGS
jgi:PAS domain S-box-containing protein